MLQVGPVDKVVIKRKQGANPYAFIEFEHPESVPYSIAVMAGVSLFNKALDMLPREGSVHAVTVVNFYISLNSVIE